jgi:hypothetical protein
VDLPKISLLRELDWSGNPFPTTSLQSFATCFFQSNTLRFLILDRVFSRESVETLASLLRLLSDSDLWGLSLRGDSDHNFGGSLNSLLSTFQSFRKLAVLHFDDQFLSSQDINLLLPCVLDLRELSIDGTTLSQSELFPLYSRLAELPNLTAIGRPNNDLARLFNGAPPPGCVILDSLRGKLQDRPSPSNASVRAHYLCELSADGALRDDFYTLWATYPRCLLIGHVSDPFFLLPPVTGGELISLAAHGKQTDLSKVLIGIYRTEWH